MKMKTAMIVCILSLCFGAIGASYKSSSSSSRSSSFKSSPSSASKPSTTYKSSSGSSGGSFSGATKPSGPTTTYKSSTAPTRNYSVGQSTKPEAKYSGKIPTTGTVNTRTTHVYHDTFHYYGGGWGYAMWWHPYNPYYFSFWHPYSWFYVGQPLPLEAPGSFSYRANYWGIAIVSTLSMALIVWMSWLFWWRE